MNVMGIVGLVFTIIFGGGAIWLSIYFFIKNNEINNRTKDLLHKIEVSTATADIRSKEVLNPVIATIISILRASTKTQIDSLGSLFINRMVTKLDEVLEAPTPEEKEVAKEEFIKETKRLLGRLRGEIGKVDLLLEPEFVRTNKKHEIGVSLLMPGAPTYEWTLFIRTIKDIENSRERGFVSVKWLREKKFARNTEYQEALQVAIDRRMLLTYSIDNPKKPQFRVLCCKLNKEHTIVNKILNAIEKAKTSKKKDIQKT